MMREQRLIDLHHHHLPPELAAAVGDQLPPPMRGWSVERSIHEMDEAAVSAAVLVLAQMGGGELGLDARLARACNEYAANLAREHNGRFTFFAWLPLPDVDASLGELAYALDELHASGVGFFTSYADRWVGDAAFAPIFDELDRRSAVAYFHPRAPACCVGLIPGVPENYIEYPQDSARAAMSLLFSGSLARHRNIRWIFSHAGGPIPIYAARVAALTAHRSDIERIAPEGIVAELQRLHFEIANAAYPPAMNALLGFVDERQVYFGSDFPFVGVRENTRAFAALPLPVHVRAAIGFENALRLLPALDVRIGPT
jgi:predicted TIM-barrel fold metal-dependent hydrolase